MTLRIRSANIVGALITATGMTTSTGVNVSSQSSAAYDQANNAYSQANSAYAAANGVFTTLNLTSNAQNTAITNAHNQANSAYSQANSARSDANTTFLTINTTFGTVNTSLNTMNLNLYGAQAWSNIVSFAAYGQANAAYGQANSARSDANTTFATVNTTFSTLNTSAGSQNTAITNAHDQANSARGQANTAYAQANAAFAAANLRLSTSGGSISGDLAITGNLTVTGNATTINVSNLSVNDSMILLSTNAVGDSNDIGFIGHFDRGATATHAGLIRKATENRFYLFDNYEVEPTNNVIDVVGNNFRVGNLRLGIINANSFVTSAGLNVTDQANSAYTAANTAQTTAQNAYGQANSAFAAANNKVASVSGTSSRITSSGGTTPTIDLATAGAGAASYSSGISALTVDAYGRVTSVTGSAAYLTSLSFDGLTNKTSGTGTYQTSGAFTASNFSDATGTYNVNLGSGGSEGRGLVAGYSGGSYGGIGYNVRHTTNGATWIAPGADTSTYLLFNAGGFAFYGAGGGSAGRTLSYTTLATLSVSGAFNTAGAITQSGNQVLHAGNYTSYSPSLTGSGASGSWSINSATTSQRAFSGDISTGGQGRFTGWNSGGAATGAATEVGYSGGEGYILAYNRDTSTYSPINISGSGCNLRFSGSTINVTAGSLQHGGNQVLHAGNYNSYALPLSGGTMTGQLNIGTATNLAFGSATRQMIDLWSTSYGIGVQSGTQYYRTGGRFSWFRSGIHSNVENDAGSGGTVAMTLDGNSSLSVTGDVRTPIFYDSNDTNYYIDPSSTSRVNTLQFSSGATAGPYFYYGNVQQNLYFRGNASSDVGMSFFDSAGNWRVQIYGNSGNYGFLASNWGSWDIQKVPGGNLFLNNQSTYYINGSEIYYNRVYGTTDIRSPIFYDNNNTAYYTDPASTSVLNGVRVVGGLGSESVGSTSPNSVARVQFPNGGAFSSDGSTGAIKIRLPFRNNNSMWTLKVRIYNYSTNTIGEYHIGAYSYNNGGYNAAASYQGSANYGARNVRIGNDGTYDCIWIGETNSSWSYPVVSVTDVMGGFRNGTFSQFGGGWDISVVASFGTVETTITPSITTTNLTSESALYTPILYDSNNTGYYVDPASTSRLNAIFCGDVYNDLGGWFRNYGATGIYNQSYDNHFYSSSSSYWTSATDNGMLFRNAYEGTIQGYVYFDGNGFGLLHSSGGWAVRTTPSLVEIYNRFDAPIMYDSNNTAFYIDANSTGIAASLNGRVVSRNTLGTINSGGSKTLAVGESYVVTSGGQTITLPASPSGGDSVSISVGNFTNTTVGRNGQNIMGLAEDMTIDTAYAGFVLRFHDATNGWRIV